MPLGSPLSLLQRADFLRNSGWAGASEHPVGEDWSQRKILRVEKGGKTAILMHAVPDDDPRMTPGHRLRDFVTISKYLRDIHLSAPKVLAQNLAQGLLLVEDFGSTDFSTVIAQRPEMEHDIYLLATRTLRHLYEKTEFIAVDLPDYYAGHVHKGHRRVVDWYMPAMRGRQNSETLVDDYLAVWKKIEKGLPRVKRRMLHVDYHLGNLMWLPERQGVEQTGLIDFQGAMMGPAPYDLVNLLEDARREVPEQIRRDCLDVFAQSLPPEDRESYLAWYPVLATQFHCRVIGQALRLAIRDGKTRLLTIIPILRRHLIRDLASPGLLPLQEWFAAEGLDFNDQREVSLDQAAKLINPNAY